MAKKKKAPNKKVSAKPNAKSNGRRRWKLVGKPFTYEWFEKDSGITYVIKAKREVTDAELKLQVDYFLLLHLRAPEPESRVEAEFVENPKQVAQWNFMNPTTAFMKMQAKEQFGDAIHFMGGSPFGLPFESPKAKTRPAGACPHCWGCGWVCEDHASLPMEGMAGGCPCGAPGMACPTCNPKAQIILGPNDFAITSSCPRCDDERWISKNKPCPRCNPSGDLAKGSCKVIRPGLN